MWASPSLKSLPRLLIGAAFVLLGWFLASATTAQADDRGLVGAVVQTVERTVDTALEPAAVTTAPVRAAVADTVARVDDAVATSTSAVEETVESAPVATAVSTPVKAVTSTVRKVSTTVTTKVVTPAVTEVTETVDAVVDDVRTTLDPVLDTVVDPPTLPGPQLPIVPGLDPGTGGPDPAPSAAGGSATEPSDADGRWSVRATAVATGSRVAPLFGTATQHGSTVSAAGVPSDPEPVVPWPSLDLGGLSPAASSGAPLTLLVAVLAMALLIVRPELRCATALLARRAPRPGPAWDPGSRPG